jgi:arylsulfatase A-like enzyme
MTSFASAHSDNPSPSATLLGTRSREGIVVSPVAAAWLGWVPFALVDQYFVSQVKVWTTPAMRIVQHHIYEFGLSMAAGAVSALCVWAYRTVRVRALPKLGKRWAMVFDAFVLSLFFFQIAMLIMRPDLETFAGRKAKPWHLPSDAIRIGFEIALALGFGVALTFGRIIARPWWRWIGVAIALVLGFGNFKVLLNDYWSLHTTLAWISGVLAGASLMGARLPTFARLPSRIELALLAAAGVFAAWAGLIPPAPGLAFRLLQTHCTPFTPLLNLRSYHGSEGAAVIPPEQAEWFKDRKDHPPIPSSLAADAPRDRIIIMMTMDATRGDVIASGEHDSVTPEIVRAEHEGVYFEDAISPSAQTVYTMTSWFSGKYFSQLYWSRPKSNGQFWPNRDPTKRIPSLLHASGIDSTYVMAAQWLSDKNGLVGGFTHYDNLMKGKGNKDYARASQMSKDVITRLHEIQAGQPYFIFAHFMDPHLPYKGVKKEKVPFDTYVHEISAVDKELGHLRREIAELGLEDRTTLIISADHGEAFGEDDHGTYQHGISVYQEMIHVPLIILGPGVKPRRIKEMISTLDLGPTVLDMFGLDTPGSMMGQSLVGVLHGGPLNLTRPIVSENRLRQTMLFPDGVKVSRDLWLGSGEAYDLKTDPKELKNRVDDPTLDTKNQFALLKAFYDANTLKRGKYKPPFRR